MKCLIGELVSWMPGNTKFRIWVSFCSAKSGTSSHEQYPKLIGSIWSSKFVSEKTTFSFWVFWAFSQSSSEYQAKNWRLIQQKTQKFQFYSNPASSSSCRRFILTLRRSISSSFAWFSSWRVFYDWLELADLSIKVEKRFSTFLNLLITLVNQNLGFCQSPINSKRVQTAVASNCAESSDRLSWKLYSKSTSSF